MADMTWRKNLSKALLPFSFGVALVAGLASLSRCFSPTLPACSFICNASEPRCPDDYECRSDNYCHLKGSTEACPYSMDLAPRPDFGGASDMTVPTDM